MYRRVTVADCLSPGRSLLFLFLSTFVSFTLRLPYDSLRYLLKDDCCWPLFRCLNELCCARCVITVNACYAATPSPVEQTLSV